MRVNIRWNNQFYNITIDDNDNIKDKILILVDECFIDMYHDENIDRFIYSIRDMIIILTIVVFLY